MSIAVSHLLTAVIFVLLGIWVGRRTSLFSTFIKPG